MTAADVLLLLGKLNLVIAAAILLVLALRRVARRSLGAGLTYGLWLLPPVAMLASLVPARRIVVHATPVASAAMALTPANGANLWDAFLAGAAGPAPVFPDIMTVAVGLWIAGAAAAALTMVHLQRRFTLEATKGAIGPAVVGLLFPRIVTPRDFGARFDPEEQALVLAHEQTHIRRQDSRLNGLAAAIQCLFWFNPLVHLAIRPMRIDQELACDEAVVSRFPEARRTYARALVKTQLANRPLPLGCYWPSGTRHPLLERIAMLKTADIGARRRLAGAVTLVTLCTACGFAAWAANPAQPIYQTSQAAAAPTIKLAALQSAPAPILPQATAKAPAVTPRAATSGVKQGGDTSLAEVCLSNACGAPATTPAPQQPLRGRVNYVGAAPVPAGQAFVHYFDGNLPVQFQGRVTAVHMTDGMSAELIVTADDGKTYRVLGGDPANLDGQTRTTFENLPGSTVAVRGYLAYDQSCEGGCLVNGRSVTDPNGDPIAPLRAPPATAQ